MSFRRFRVLSFDCHRTPIDWEQGSLTGLTFLRQRAGFRATDAALGGVFDAVHTAEEIGSHKPDLAKVHYMIERFSAD